MLSLYQRRSKEHLHCKMREKAVDVFIMTTTLSILMILVETNGNTPITMTTDSILLAKKCQLLEKREHFLSF